jgi:hypothetical protein
MKSKNINTVESTPAHALLSPTDNNKVLDFINFNSVGSNNVTGSNAFKKIQSSSKSNPQDLFSYNSDYSLKYNKINNLYLNDLSTQDSLFYGIKRQHEYASTSAVFNGCKSNLDNKSVSTLLSYNNNVTLPTNSYVNTSLNETLTSESSSTNTLLSAYVNPTSATTSSNQYVDNRKEFGNKVTSVGNEMLDTNVTTVVQNNTIPTNVLSQSTPTNLLDQTLQYSPLALKSPNQQILSSDRNIRNTDNLGVNKVNLNTVATPSNLTQLSTTFTASHLPSTFKGSNAVSIAYDRFTPAGMNSGIMAAKEELAPNFIFTPF